MTDEAPYGWLVVQDDKVVGFISPSPYEAPMLPADREGARLVPLPGWLNVKRGLVDYIAMRERREVYRRGS